MQALGPLRPRGLVLELGICLKRGLGMSGRYLGLSAGSSSSRVQREVVSFSLLFSKVHKYLEA